MRSTYDASILTVSDIVLFLACAGRCVGGEEASRRGGGRLIVSEVAHMCVWVVCIGVGEQGHAVDIV